MGQQHGQALTEHGLDPGWCPPEIEPGVTGGGESVRVTGLDGFAQAGQVLHRGQFEVQLQVAAPDRVT